MVLRLWLCQSSAIKFSAGQLTSELANNILSFAKVHLLCHVKALVSNFGPSNGATDTYVVGCAFLVPCPLLACRHWKRG